MSSTALTTVRILLALCGIALAFGYHPFHVRGGEWQKRIYAGLLMLAAVFGLYFYMQLGPQFRRTELRRVMNAHDFAHYYLGSKYFRELGYFDLYECLVVADSEANAWAQPEWSVRDLRNYRYRRVSQILQDPARCKSLFTEARWTSFTEDVRDLSRLTWSGTLMQILQDKGYNATPVWTLVVARLTNLVSMRSTAGLYLLLVLDWLLTIAIFVAVGRTFGWRGALLLVVFWSANFMSATFFVKGSLLRLDWLACVIGSLCLIRTKRYTAAGVLAGVATSLRIFPGLFFAGLLFKMIFKAIRTRELTRSHRRFVAAFAIATALLVGVTSLTQSGRQRWGDFEQKISLHDRQIAGYRVGFKYALLDAEGQNRVTTMEQFESAPTRQVWWLAQTLMLATVFFAAQRMRDHQTVGLSFICVFFLTAPTFYYYQMLAVPFLLFLPREDREGRGVGAAVLFGWCVVANFFGAVSPLGFTLSHWLSWSLLWLCAAIALLAFTLRWSTEAAASTERFTA